jgi:hypothetical protein
MRHPAHTFAPTLDIHAPPTCCDGLADNRRPDTLFQQMTETEQQAVPHGFTQITEGRIRTTDIICGESGGWAVPHVFLVGGDIADDGRPIARPHVKKPGGRS